MTHARVSENGTGLMEVGPTCVDKLEPFGYTRWCVMHTRLSTHLQYVRRIPFSPAFKNKSMSNVPCMRKQIVRKQKMEDRTIERIFKEPLLLSGRNSGSTCPVALISSSFLLSSLWSSSSGHINPQSISCQANYWKWPPQWSYFPRAHWTRTQLRLSKDGTLAIVFHFWLIILSTSVFVHVSFRKFSSWSTLIPSWKGQRT